MMKRSRRKQAEKTPFILVILVMGITTLCPGNSQACEGLFGDLTNSGEVNALDVQCSILSTLAALSPSATTPKCLAGELVQADVSCEDGITVTDVLMTINAALGIPLDPVLDGDSNNCPDACEPCVGAGCPGTPCKVEADCVAGTFCDAFQDPPLCTPQKSSFWTQHNYPDEVVDGQRVVFFVSSTEGDDWTGDGSQDFPFKTINRGYLAVREAAGAYTGTYGFPEHAGRGEIGALLGGVPTLHGALLLRRGDAFHIDDERDYLMGAGLGDLPNTLSGCALLALEVGGVSEDERFILGTYGPEGPGDYSGDRPKIYISRNAAYESGAKEGQQVACQAITIDVMGYGTGQPSGNFCPNGVLEDCLDDIATIRHVTIEGIEIAPGEPSPGPFPIYHRDHLSPALIAVTLREGVAEDFLFEDLYIHHLYGGIFTSGSYGLDTYPFGDAANDIRIRHRNLKYRRCIFAETYGGLSGQSTPSAIAGRNADDVLMDECIFDQVSWSGDLDPVAASDGTVFPDKIAFHTMDEDTVPEYSDVAFEPSWGAFSSGASPHTIYIRHEGGGNYRARGSMVLRPAANRDKWNAGVHLLNSVYIDGGLFIGAGGDQFMASSAGQGIQNATIQHSVFEGLSNHYNDYGISFFGNSDGGQVSDNLFRIRGESRRPAMTIENRTGEPATVSLNLQTGTFTLNGATLTLTSGDPECTSTGLSAQCTGWTPANLCNFINGLRAPGEMPGSQFRCALRESTRGAVLYSYASASGVIAPGEERFVLYTAEADGDFHHGTVTAAMKWTTLILPENLLDLLENAGWTSTVPVVSGWTGIRVSQPATGAEAWIRKKVHLFEDKSEEGISEFRVLLRQSGELVTSPLFLSLSEGGGPLVFTYADTPTPEPDADTFIYEGDYDIEQPAPLMVENNVFDQFGGNTTPESPVSTEPRGNHIRLAGMSGPVTIRNNAFYSPIAYWGTSTLMSRPGMVLVSPGHQMHIAGVVNSSGPDKQGIFDLWWSEDEPISLAEMVRAPLTFLNNDIRYEPNAPGDFFFGFNISEFANWMQFNTGSFLEWAAWCDALPEGSKCGDTGKGANRLHTNDDDWVDAGAPDPDAFWNATFGDYRESIGLALPPSRYQNPTTRLHEMDFASQVIRNKRRGQWSQDYDVYALLNFFRSHYGQPPVTSPYAN